MMLFEMDSIRYGNNKMPRFQKYYRKADETKMSFLKPIYRVMKKFYTRLYMIELPKSENIGGGLYIGHLYCITINPNVVIGNNVNIHKGVTIGQENRGERKGTPHIGNEVWIGINSTIVGGVTIGDDVLIAPNTYVNCNIPSHSIVFGNPCIIRHNGYATQGYINRKADI